MALQYLKVPYRKAGEGFFIMFDGGHGQPDLIGNVSVHGWGMELDGL